MADVQKYFIEFHDNIKLGRFDENKELREKRDIVLGKLSERLKALFEDRDEDLPTYQSFGQGSYAMDTGIKPIEGDYDIDVGLVFDIASKDYPDPVIVKCWVRDALTGHTKSVEIRRSCVTVFYQIDDEPVYHVDLTIYSSEALNADGFKHIAKGKEFSQSENRVWEQSDPVRLCELVGDRHSGDDAKQFRRVIRYLKRWKDHKFSADGNAAPPGIALTVAAYNWCMPSWVIVDAFKNTKGYNDLKALKSVVDGMVNNFRTEWNGETWVERLDVLLPVTPYSNLLDRMTDNQMIAFKEKLEGLRDSLQSAADDAAPEDACATLQKVLGDDFPVPPKESTARQAVLGSSSSGSSA
jgi:hypothetical protein